MIISRSPNADANALAFALGLALAAWCVLAVPGPAWAGEPVGAKEPESFGQIIWEKTNWIGHVFYATLALFSIMATAVALERLVHLRRGRVVPAEFVSRLRDMLARGEDSAEHLRWLCQNSAAPIATILKSGLARAGRPLLEVEKAMEDAAAREMAEIRSRSRVLSVLGTVAPLVGLHGTVVGMIFAFRVSSTAGLGKAELLAEGIYLALLTTAAGLTIAIPSLLLVAWFNHRADRYFREIDAALGETLPSFARMEPAGPGSPRLSDAATTPVPR